MPSADSDDHAILSVTDLAFSRNEEAVFGPLQFHIDAGETLLVQGGNGAGKTTLLRVLVGLLRADRGEIRIHGRLAGQDERNRTIAYLGHLPALKADLTALENLQFLGDLHGGCAGRRLARALDLVGLSGYDATLVRRLSAGQRKRLSLARIWLTPAPLWLLDEPYANLDLPGIALVNQLIQTHLRDGGAAMVTSHGAYAAPPVRTRILRLGCDEEPPK